MPVVAIEPSLLLFADFVDRLLHLGNTSCGGRRNGEERHDPSESTKADGLLDLNSKGNF